jgi:hypothetical protein
MLESVRRPLFALFLLVIALVPFELPVTEGLHGILKPLIGDAYMLFFCGSWLAAVSLLYLWWQWPRMENGWRQYSLYAVLFAFPGLLAVAVSGMVPQAKVQLSIQQLLFGYLAPLLFCFALFSMTEVQQRRVWLAFYSGWCLFLAGSLVFLTVSLQATDEAFGQLKLGEKLFLWRSTFGEPWNLYSVYLGNANKESNYILMFLVFSSCLLGSDGIQKRGIVRRVYFAYWALAVLTLLLLFSRAALLLLPVAVLASGFWKVLGRKMRWALAAAGGSAIMFGYATFGPALVYLFTARTFFDTSTNALGSFSQRFDQWAGIRDFLFHHSTEMFIGLGTAGYGLRFFGSVDRGTHNMFLDTLLESGIAGFVALAFLVAWLLLHSMNYFRDRQVNAVALIGTLCLVALMLREHSVSYLYVTSLGGLCFATLFYLLARPIPRSTKS